MRGTERREPDGPSRSAPTLHRRPSDEPLDRASAFRGKRSLHQSIAAVPARSVGRTASTESLPLSAAVPTVTANTTGIERDRSVRQRQPSAIRKPTDAPPSAYTTVAATTKGSESVSASDIP